MLTIKFLKYGELDKDSGKPTYTESVFVRSATDVKIVYEKDNNPNVILSDIHGLKDEYKLGRAIDCYYEVAYIMNEAGKTVETIR